MNLTLIQQKIHYIRGEKVMPDFDIAILYEVETKQLKRAVRRNIERFPEDFMFELTNEECTNLPIACTDDYLHGLPQASLHPIRGLYC